MHSSRQVEGREWSGGDGSGVEGREGGGQDRVPDCLGGTGSRLVFYNTNKRNYTQVSQVPQRHQMKLLGNHVQLCYITFAK